MASKILFGGSLVLFAGVASAQNLDRAVQMKGSPKDGGIYHIATKTWTRTGNGQTTAGVPEVLYNNTAPSGYFGVSGTPRDLNWTDEGRFPAANDPVPGNGDSYIVTGFQVAYCAGGGVAPVNGGWDIYNNYTACSDPRLLTPALSTGIGAVPGNPTTASVDCWILTFDFQGTSFEFKVDADGNGTYNGSSSLDNFGWGFHLDNGLASNLLGPILCYDPLGYYGCAALEGDGTKFQAGVCTSPYPFGNFGSGLGDNDRHYSWSPTATSTAPNGCYWFGGYSSTGLQSAFWMVVYGTKNGGGIGTPYCTSNPNSVNAAGASISMTGDGDATTGDEVATATGLPNQSGIFFHGRNQIAVAFGCGWLCAGVNIQRGTAVSASGGTATYAYDQSNAKRDLTPFAGQTRRFQFWYRDPMNFANCGNTFNYSNGLSVGF